MKEEAVPTMNINGVLKKSRTQPPRHVRPVNTFQLIFTFCILFYLFISTRNKLFSDKRQSEEIVPLNKRKPVRVSKMKMC